MGLVRIEGIGDELDLIGVDRLPLLGTRRAGGELPLEGIEVVEIVAAPVDRRGRPSTFQPAGGGIRASAGAAGVLPAKALRLDAFRRRFLADAIRRLARAVHLADGVPADDQRDGFLVIHAHPAECGADLLGCGEDVGVAARAFGVDVDESHFGRAERVVEVLALGITLGGQELGFRAPIDQLRLPRIGAATGKAEGLEAGVLQRDVARQDDEIGPRKRRAILLLDRPQHAAGLVEVAVVGPGIQRLEADLPAVRTPAPVARAIGAGRVPGQADEQPGIIAVVRRPPILRIRQRGVDVGLHGLEIELGEFLGVIEIGPVGVGVVFVLAQTGEVDDVRPPALHVARGGLGLRHGGAAHARLVEARRRGGGRPGREQRGREKQECLGSDGHH